MVTINKDVEIQFENLKNSTSHLGCGYYERTRRYMLKETELKEEIFKDHDIEYSVAHLTLSASGIKRIAEAIKQRPDRTKAILAFVEMCDNTRKLIMEISGILMNSLELEKIKNNS